MAATEYTSIYLFIYGPARALDIMLWERYHFFYDVCLTLVAQTCALQVICIRIICHMFSQGWGFPLNYVLEEENAKYSYPKTFREHKIKKKEEDMCWFWKNKYIYLITAIRNTGMSIYKYISLQSLSSFRRASDYFFTSVYFLGFLSVWREKQIFTVGL